MIPARSALTRNEQCTPSHPMVTFQKALLPGSCTFLSLHDYLFLLFFSVLSNNAVK